jgi:eukaryotic-like serine/threonine-protein kinase
MTQSMEDTSEYDQIDRLAEEFADRFRRGERPTLEEYIDRRPGLADEIREVFPALVKVRRAAAICQDRGAAEWAGPAAPIPARVGDFRILREIGRGGMGIVYQAEQVSLGRTVALKVMPGRLSGDRTSLERFRREARAAARLHHTNIVPVFEVGEEGDVRYFAMQFIDGLGLDAVVAELHRLLGRARSQSGIQPTSRGRSPRPRGEPSLHDIETPTLGDGVEVSLVLRSILTGRFDSGGRRPDPPGAPTSMRTGTVTDGRAAGSDRALTRTAAGGATGGDETAPGTAHPTAPASSPSASASSTSAILPGGTQLSSVESGRREFYRSLAQIGRQVAGGLAYAHARSRAPGHQAVEPPAGHRGRGLDRRFRPGQGGGRGADAERRHPGDAPLHGPRALSGRRGCPGRHLRVGADALRAAHAPPGLRVVGPA